ncbi:MAG: hypothetical protein IJ678_08925 [Kiritimatiellae bacterium]|nr:hypothetical protein [Kiritimatiellia bacterium]
MNPNRSQRKSCLLSILIAVGLAVGYEILSLDGWLGLLFRQFFPDTTVYAPEWNYWKFRWVRTGMTKERVLSLLGTPLETWPWDSNPAVETWAYTRSSEDSHFELRCIWIKDGKVIGKEAEYYVD